MSMDDITYTRSRLRKAEELADSLRHDDRLHELALNAVFAIEDRLLALEEAAAGGTRRRMPAESRGPTASVIRFPPRATARAR